MNSSYLVAGHRLARNSLLTLCTNVVLLAASIAVVPLLLRAFGRELYGILAITWMLVVHLGWLDLGFSRAAARFVARELVTGDPIQPAIWGWTALVTQAAMGTCAGIVLWLAAPFVVESLHVSEPARGLAVLTLRLFALSLPLELAARSLTGILQAGQRFDWVNGLSVVTVALSYGAYAVGVTTGDFRLIVYGLVVARALTFVSTFAAATRVLPSLLDAEPLRRALSQLRFALAMLRFGGWIALAAALGPLLLYFDQWTIGVLLGAATLPFYAVPLSFLLRLSVLPSSLTGTLFPAFSVMDARQDWGRARRYFLRAHRYLVAAVLPLVFLIYVWAPEILRIWIDDEFSQQGTTPLRILVAGVAVGLLAPLSGALLEAIGRPDLVAKLYLVELPLNVVVVVVLTLQFGLAGAAASYAIRTLLETMVLWCLVARVTPFFGEPARAAVRGTVLAPLLATLGVAGYILADARIDDARAIGFTLVTLALYGILAARFLLDRDDLALARGLLHGRRT